MQKKIVLFLLIVFSLSPSLAHAVSDSEITDNLKKRLQTSIDSTEVKDKSANRAYLGVVKDIIKDTLIIEEKGGRRDIKLNDKSTIVRSPGSGSIKPEDIRISDSIIAIGKPGENNNFDGVRLIVSVDPILAPAKTSDIGTISKIGKSSLSIKQKDSDATLTLSDKTIIKSPSGIIELSDLSVGDTVIYTATTAEKDVISATLIMRIKTSSL